MDRAAWDERYRGSDLVWSAGPNQFLVDEIGDLPPGRALDVAAGEGRNALWLAERGWDVTALDFSEVALDKGRSLGEARGLTVRWLAADVGVWDPGPADYDLVIVLYLQLPSAERSQAFRAATGALAPGGTLLMIGHDRRNLDEGHGGPQDPDVLWTPAEMRLLLDDLLADEVVVERAETIERVVDADQGTATALDTLVRAHRVDDGPDGHSKGRSSHHG